MANTYTSLHYHLVFSTKHREPWITAEIEQRIWAFLGGIARENRLKLLQIGGVNDHYGAFTVSKSQLLEVIAYIQNQRQHHRRETFKEEFLALLERHEINYDERYLWD